MEEEKLKTTEGPVSEAPIEEAAKTESPVTDENVEKTAEKPSECSLISGTDSI